MVGQVVGDIQVLNAINLEDEEQEVSRQELVELGTKFSLRSPDGNERQLLIESISRGSSSRLWRSPAKRDGH